MGKRIGNKSRILIWVMILFFVCSNFSYANQPIKTFRNLDERVDYLKQIIQYIEDNYVGEISEEALAEGAYRGVFDALDPYSRYFGPEELKEFQQQTSGKYSGIGATVGIKDKEIVVIAPIEGGPAAKAGIKAGDVILSVGNTTVEGNALENVVNMLLGNPGTKVKVTIKREGVDKTLDFHITREIITLNSIRTEILGSNIGYIQILEFNEGVGVKVEEALKNLNDKKVKGIILDLRNNPGGLIEEAVDVADLFIPKGPVVHVVYNNKDKQTYSSLKDKIDKPLVVLINGGSASASEIVTGAVQDTKSGTIIGTKSYGKGTVQSIIPITNGGGIKLTIAKYLTPNGRMIDGSGIQPDIILENPDIVELNGLGSFAPMIEETEAVAGDKGLNVYGTQQRLKWLGYKEVETTGILDKATLDALKKFQKSTGLEDNGILNMATLIKIEEKILEILQNSAEDLQLKKAIEVIKGQ
ncbi:MAG: S41 family peptidase [Thermotaleaceae bacterium]